MGRLADYAWPEPLGKAVVGLYCRAYNVEMGECAKTSGFASFDEFFTRELRDGARTMPDDPRIAVSPADGRVDSIGPIAGRAFRVKGRPYQVDELVGDAEEAKRYDGGTGCVVYLSPRDYHRVHSPVEGAIVTVRSMPGDYYPVNAIGVLRAEFGKRPALSPEGKGLVLHRNEIRARGNGSEHQASRGFWTCRRASVRASDRPGRG